MARLSVLYYGDPRLREKAKRVESVTSEIKALVADLIETMIAQDGIGLAATQVGAMVRIFVMRNEHVDVNGEIQLGDPEVLINPILSKPSKQTEESTEGCLSLPRLYVEVERPLEIQIFYQTLEGEVRQEMAKGMRARIMMHENDHLNGVLMIDRINARDRQKIEPTLRAIQARAASTCGLQGS